MIVYSEVSMGFDRIEDLEAAIPEKLYRREAIQRNLNVIPVSTREHEAVVEAIAKGDSALAARLLYDHVINSRSRLHEKDRQAA